MINYREYPSADAVVESLAEQLKAFGELGRPVHISLSGGSTPKLLFQRLAKAPYCEGIQWQNLHFWWGDERCVAPDSPESNYGEANNLLFSQVAIPSDNIHRIRGEDNPESEAIRFAREMSEQISCDKSGVPVFDWILLGVGGDGHTASLFPGQTDYQEQKLAVVAAHPESGQLRVSKTARVLEAAHKISYLVLGAGKADIVHQIHTHDADALPYPAAKIRSLHGDTQWLLDSAAADKISKED